MINTDKYKELGNKIENSNEEVVDKIVLVDITKIKPNENNFYDEEYEIESLAQQIKLTGQIEPVLVTRDYKLISGHRRYRAMTLLGETHIKCRLLKSDGIADEDSERLTLIQANSYRIKSPEELKEEVLICNAIYSKMYQNGEISKGDVAKLTSADVGKSIRQVQRLTKDINEEVTALEIEAYKNDIDLSEYNNLADDMSLKQKYDYLKKLLKEYGKETKKDEATISKQEKLNSMVLKMSKFIEKNNDDLELSSELYNAVIDHVVEHNQTKLNV